MVRSTCALLPLLLSVALCIANAAPATSRAALPDAAPRYRLEVGQELLFKEVNDVKYGKGRNQLLIRRHSEWKIWVVRKNDDGSYRLVLHSTESTSVDERKPSEPTYALAYCDLTTDGRLVPNSTIDNSTNVALFFPRLPADEWQYGWTDFEKATQTATSFRVQSRPKHAGGLWTIREVRKSPLDESLLGSHAATLVFDPNRGLVTRIETESAQEWPNNAKGTGVTELVSIEHRGAEWTRRLGEQADRYFAISRAYDGKIKAATRDARAINRLLDEAGVFLVDAQKIVTLPLFQDELDRQLIRHGLRNRYYRQVARLRAKVVGRPAAKFLVDDVDGHPHSLADFKGKVVILDFWFRGCPGCMLAMPQLKQLEADFRDQPVAIFGMYAGANDADARFIIERIGFTYPTLKAQSLLDKYGICSFPTLVIIDQQGIVHDLYIGDSPDLRTEVGDIVRNLLAKK
jgi:thiol-disulfide isomerase/thioredoxin